MEIVILPRAPFDFEATARFLRYTETETVDTFSEGRYARAFHFQKHLHLLNVRSRGTLMRPLLVASFERGSGANRVEKEQAARLVQHIFSTDHDLRKFRARVAGDKLMSELEAAHRGLHIARWPKLFEALTVSILSQQISTLVAMTLKRRLVEKFGERLSAGAETFHAFPKAERLARASIEELRALGCSGSKALSIIELAQSVCGGRIDEEELNRADNESIIEQLVSLRGIGRWTAEWALMLYFGRTDVFPAGDLAFRNFVVKYYNEGRAMTEREIRAFARSRWGEWAAYAGIYCLAGMRAGLINLTSKGVLLSGAASKTRAAKSSGK
ncbi:MAG: AlkA N-terminal domain-containing protein [Pyrinomonadaceae bacterium]